MSSRANGGRALRGFASSAGDGGGAGRGKGRGHGKGKAAEHDPSSSSSVIGRDSVRRVGRSKVRRNAEDAVESKLGYEVFREGEPRLGWLITVSPVSQAEYTRTHMCAHTHILSLSLSLSFSPLRDSLVSNSFLRSSLVENVKPPMEFC